MKVHNLLVTGSLTSGGENIGSISSSVATTNNTQDNRISSLEVTTGSLNVFTSSASSRLNSIENVTGSYATTGSNQFKNNQVITGSLTVTGFIDAQELRTTYISSSILYRSGSTKFGDELGDTHSFTGSLIVSGNSTFSSVVGINGAIEEGWGLKVYENLKVQNNNGTTVLQVADTATGGKIWSLISSGNGNTHSIPAGTFYLRNSTDSLSALAITSGGNVGIGTTNPGTILHLVQSGGPTLRMVRTSNRFDISADNDFMEINARDASTYMIFKTADTERVRVNSGGEVLIGLTSRVTGLSGFTQLEVSGGEGGITINSNTTTTDKYSRLMFTKSGATGNEGLIRYNVNNYHMSFWTNANEQMRITSDGSLLVGATNADVGGSVKGAIVRQNGSIVGATNISSPFHYQSPIAADRMNTQGDGLMYGMWRQGIFQAGIGATNGSAMTFFTGNNDSMTEQMRITSGGSVGIGLTNPGAILDVSHTAGTSNIIRVSNGAGNYRWRVDQLFSMIMTNASNVDTFSVTTAGAGTFASNVTTSGNIELTSGANRNITLGSVTNYNYRLRTDGDDFVITEAGITDRLRYSYSNVRWTITGGLVISGSLSKGSGSFRIDHPLPSKKDTHKLVHSFIEGPQADNIYRGKIVLVNGSATINLDSSARMTEGTFVLLNGNIQCFTSNESGWTSIRGNVEGNILTIESQDSECTDTISWLVIGERIDQHMIDTDWTDENGKVIVEPLITEV